MRCRWDSVTASRGNPCRPRGRRSLTLTARLPEATPRTVEQWSRITDAKIGGAMGGAWKIAVTLLPAVCAALALSACGGGSDTTASTPAEIGTSGVSEHGNGANYGGGESKNAGGG